MSKIRICINGMTENEQIRGPVRYIYEIVSNMPTSDFDIYLIAGKWQKCVYESLEMKVNVIYFDINQSKLSRALFFIFYMPMVIKIYNIDIYHIPDTNPLPLFRRKAKVISTIHDCAEFVVPGRFSFFQTVFRKIISRFQALFSDCIITVSQSSKDDILKYHAISRTKVHVVYNGITRLPVELNDVPIREERKNIPYILYVGVLEKEKNVERLVEAFSQLKEGLKQSVKLYLVGRKGNAYDAICYVINKYSLHDSVEIFGYVEDYELNNLYEHALVFAYLSEYEGFGLPILEAMQYGIPVLTSNKSSLKEVAGDAALLTDTSVKDIKNNLTLLLSDVEMREMYKAKGKCKAQEFCWQKAAIETGLLYKQIIQ